MPLGHAHPPLPAPPASQSEIDKIDLVLVKMKQLWYRMHTTLNDPLHFGRSGFSFDSIAGLFGTLYVAADMHGAFIETFGRVLGFRQVTQSKLNKKSIAILKTDKLTLIDITGKGASITGLDGRITTDTNYDGLTRPWADALYKHKAAADGILFRARHDQDQIVAAIFERASQKIAVDSEIDLFTRQGMKLIQPIARAYNFGIIDDTTPARKQRKRKIPAGGRDRSQHNPKPKMGAVDRQAVRRSTRRGGNL